MHIWKHVNENIKTRANFDYGVMQKRKAHPPLRAEPPFFFFLIEKELGIKIGSTWIASILWTVFIAGINPVFFRQTGFSIA